MKMSDEIKFDTVTQAFGAGRKPNPLQRPVLQRAGLEQAKPQAGLPLVGSREGAGV